MVRFWRPLLLRLDLFSTSSREVTSQIEERIAEMQKTQEAEFAKIVLRQLTPPSIPLWAAKLPGKFRVTILTKQNFCEISSKFNGICE